MHSSVGVLWMYSLSLTSQFLKFAEKSDVIWKVEAKDSAVHLGKFNVMHVVISCMVVLPSILGRLFCVLKA